MIGRVLDVEYLCYRCNHKGMATVTVQYDDHGAPQSRDGAPNHANITCEVCGAQNTVEIPATLS